MRWGDRYGNWPDGPPLVIVHKRCGGEMDVHFIGERCGRRLGPRDARAVPGPGATSRVRERAEPEPRAA